MSSRRNKGCLGRIVSLIVACIIAVVAVFALTNIAVVMTSRGKIVSEQEAVGFGADYIVVLGASVYADGTPSGVLKDRLDDGIALYFAGAAPAIIMSGDGGDGGSLDKGVYDEVEAMCNYAIEQGVPESALVRDEAGYSTYESMYRAAHVFGAQRVVIATQAYHLYRALYVAQGCGISAVGVPSDYRDYQNQFQFDVREIPARTKDFFQTLFHVPLTSAAAVGAMADAIEGSPSSR